MIKKVPGGERLSKTERKVPGGGRLLMIGRRAKIHRVVLDLGRLIIGMRDELRHLLRDDIRLDLTFLSAARCLVVADPQQMHELILHLVLDARDSMPDGGLLSITIGKRRIGETDSLHLKSPGEYVMVAVRDSPVRRDAGSAEAVNSRVTKGRGLSLAASYDAIKKCGGHLTVSGRAGETTFRIFLPRHASSAQAALGRASR